MFINKIGIFVTISHDIHFGTAKMITNHQASTFVKCIKQVLLIYQQPGFHIMTALMDNKFEPIHSDLASLHIGLNTMAKDEHAPVAEWYIQTLKEQVPGIYNALLFMHYPPQLIIEMVYASVFWFNTFPHTTGQQPY